MRCPEHVELVDFGVDLDLSHHGGIAGPTGTQVTLTGAYFSPSAQVSITWIDHWGFTYTPTYVQTTSSGMFTVSLTIPNCPSNSCSYDCAGNSCYYAITDMVTNVGLAEPFQVT